MTKPDPLTAELHAAIAINQLVRTLHLIRTRPPEESAFIAAVNLDEVQKRFGIDVAAIIGDGKWVPK